MPVRVFSSRDRGEAYRAGRSFLEADPLRNCVVMEILCQPQPGGDGGQFWWVDDGTRVSGLVAQHSPESMALVSPMNEEAVDAVAAAIAESGVDLPGASADAATAALFAGKWTERTNGAAVPCFAQRICAAEALLPPKPAEGRLRRAVDTDADELIGWLDEFGAETGDPVPDSDWLIRQRLSEHELWVWDCGRSVSMAARTPAVAGISRVQAVFTPCQYRGQRFAANVVAAITAAILDDGLRPMLYTDLANSTSNMLYRSLGYRAVEEVTRYRFSHP